MTDQNIGEFIVSMERHANAILALCAKMRAQEYEKHWVKSCEKIPFPRKISYFTGRTMSPAVSVKFAIEYAAWSQSDEGREYIAKNGDPYEEEKMQETQASDWFRGREILAKSSAVDDTFSIDVLPTDVFV